MSVEPDAMCVPNDFEEFFSADIQMRMRMRMLHHRFVFFFRSLRCKIGVWLVYIAATAKWPVVSSQCLKKLLLSSMRARFYYCLLACELLLFTLWLLVRVSMGALHWRCMRFTLIELISQLLTICQLNKKPSRNKQVG